MHDWWTDLDALYTRVWDTLVKGVHVKREAARHVAFATAGQTGGAEARMVVLRGADRAGGKLYVHSDTMSAKVAELRADPRASILVWDPAAHLQIRLKCEVGIDTGDCVAPEWRRIPEPSRRVYGNGDEPGQGMDCPEALTVTPNQSRFAVMTCTIREIDALHLGRDMHHRAQYSRSQNWQGRWVTP